MGGLVTTTSFSGVPNPEQADDAVVHEPGEVEQEGVVLVVLAVVVGVVVLGGGNDA